MTNPNIDARITPAKYTLHVTFKSNENPWSTEYDPGPEMQHRFSERSTEAERWAYNMQEGMGAGYICVLKRDGAPIYDATKPMLEMCDGAELRA